jgi:predicted alpha/beta hydrolase family esterase
MKQKVVIIPGNGGSNVEKDHWYSWVRGRLIGLGYHVVMKNMPDPVAAHMDIWLAFMEEGLGVDADTIVIGHSSGGVATLRYLETHKLKGAVVIGVNHTDLGDAGERESGYYTAPWQWDKIKTNAGFIVQFCSPEDPYININEPYYIHDMVESELHDIRGAGHFMTPVFPELLAVLHAKAPVIK